MRDAPFASRWRRIVWTVVVFITRLILFRGARLRCVGTVPPTGPLLLVSNHISHFDPPLIAIALQRPVDWIAMTELFAARWSRALFLALNAIPVRRGTPDRTALRDAVARLAAGRLVGIFPEGGIRDGEVSLLCAGRPRGGAWLLARLSGAPVLPCVILGSDRLYNPRRWLPGCRARVWISFGEPFHPPPSEAEFAAELLTRLHALRDLLLTAHGATTDDLPQSPRTRMAEK